MQGKPLFLNRVVSRTREWQSRYPALGTASHIPGSLSGGRQVVAAAADQTGVRCAFFTNHGSVLDFSATWAELEGAKTWWHFVGRWNFWVISDERSLKAIRSHGHEQLSAVVSHVDVDRHDEERFVTFLNRAETRARAYLAIAPDSATLDLATTQPWGQRTSG